MSKELDPKDVELFLLDNLDFFESRESLVGELKFKHSSASAASILERQVKKLREEHKNLMDLLSSFMKTASTNEDLFNKSKDLTLEILDSGTKQETINVVQSSFSNDFKVDKCYFEFYKNTEIQEIENITGLSFHKGAIHCGSFSSEKMNVLFKDESIQSIVVAVVVIKNEVGLLKIGSFDRAKYLGDEDTTFIQYIRDILEVKLTK